MLGTLLWIVLAILAATTLYVVANTARFSRRQRAVEHADLVPVDPEAVAERLAQLVRCKTAPLDDKGTPEPEAFDELHHTLRMNYPLVHECLKREVIGGYSLLYTWEGTRPELEPAMLMAHQDVV